MRALLLLALLILPGCMTVSAPPCAGAARPQLRAELIFGRSTKGRGIVSEAAWRRFLDEEVTPRFPDGFTVMDGRGQWRGAGWEKIVKEKSKVLVVAMTDEPERRARLAAIAEAYKARFKQEAVVTLLTRAASRSDPAPALPMPHAFGEIAASELACVRADSPGGHGEQHGKDLRRRARGCPPARPLRRAGRIRRRAGSA